MYNSPEELQEKITEYFKTGLDYKKVIVGPPNNREAVEIPVPTITGLVLFCGFCDRHSFYAYENKKEFSHTIKKARTMIEKEYEMLIATVGHSGAIFALKNFGWTDRYTVVSEDHKYLHVEFKEMSREDLEVEAKNVHNRIAEHIGSGGLS